MNSTLTAIIAKHRNEQLANGTRAKRWVKRHVGTTLELVRDKRTGEVIAFRPGEPIYREVEINARLKDGIDKAPVEISPCFYRGNEASHTLMYDLPRKPATRIKEYLTIRRHSRDYGIRGLSELSHPPFEVLKLELAKPERSKWINLEKPSASSLVPDFSGDSTIQLAPRERTDSAIATSVGAQQLAFEFIIAPRLMFHSTWQWPRVSLDTPIPIPGFTGTQIRLPL